MVNLKSVLSIIVLNIDGQILQLKMVILVGKISKRASYIKVKVLVAQLCSTLCDLWTVACQAPLSMGFSRQEYWWVAFSFSGDSS